MFCSIGVIVTFLIVAFIVQRASTARAARRRRGGGRLPIVRQRAATDTPRAVASTVPPTLSPLKRAVDIALISLTNNRDSITYHRVFNFSSSST